MKKHEEIVERDEYYVDRNYTNYSLKQKLEMYVLVGVAGSGLSIIVVGGLVWLAHLFPVIQYTFIGAIASLPVIGIGFLGVTLWKYIRKVQVIAIADKGNIIRLANGNTQVISTEEVYAYETKDAIQPKPIELPRIQSPNIVEAGEDLYYQNTGNDRVFPEVFTEGNDYPTVYTRETEVETVAETVLENLRQEEAIAKQQLAAKERDVIKQRIMQLRKSNLSLRSIAAIVHMQGRKYNDFKDICKELGINTD